MQGKKDNHNYSQEKFGRWTVLEFSFKKYGKNYWKCRCECGVEKNIIINNLKCGESNSCGCLQKEMLSKLATKHGLRHARIYNIWASIKQRCNNSKSTAYKNYGGRGVTVCDEWIKFENFYKDMGKTYEDHVKIFGKDNTQIERKNNELGYCKKNCEWATRKEQNNNRRNNRLITYDGKIMTIVQWSEFLNIGYKVLSNRINSGWTVQLAFTTPIKNHNNYISYNGKTLTVEEWSKIINIPHKALYLRIRTGWSPERALMTSLRITKPKKKKS